MDYAIKVEHISYAYEKGKNVINDVSFSVPKGKYVTLVGHNGSGKSTIAKILTYLIQPTEGKIYFNDKEITEENYEEIRQNVGIVFQNPDNQFIGNTVEDDIAFGLENRNVEKSKMIDLVKEFATKVSMQNYLRKEPSELSGGQKQRVAIAGILALDLKLIIFDEATSMLDPEGVSEIKKLIFEIKEKNPDFTFISITHDIEEAYLSDYCFVLNKGSIYKEGKPEDIFIDEKELNSLGLDIPFVVKVKNSLKEKGINIDKNVKTIEELGDILCKQK